MSETSDGATSTSPTADPDDDPDPGLAWISTSAGPVHTTSTTTTPTTTTTPWDDTIIDPQLFSQSVAPSVSASVSVDAQNSMDFMNLHVSSYPPVPYVSSSSSELAGALTLPSPANDTQVTTNTTVDSGHIPSYYRQRLPDGTHMQSDPATPKTSPVESNGNEKSTLTPDKQVDGEERQNGHENEDVNDDKNDESLGDNHMCDGIADSQDPDAVSTVDGLSTQTRFCSVKGCKAVIPGPSL